MILVKFNNKRLNCLFFSDAPPPEKVERWLATGDVQNLENLVLDGRSHLLLDKDSVNLATSEFLDGLTQYQAKIDAIHKAVEEGDVRRVKSLIDRIQLSTARDRHGMTPLHKALLYGQTNTVRYLLAKYPHCVNCTDHVNFFQIYNFTKTKFRRVELLYIMLPLIQMVNT